MQTYSLASFHHPSGSNNQDYLCTYPTRIEHAGIIEKGRDRDRERERERDQGQPKARVSSKKVEKEVKNTRGTGQV